MVLKGEKNRGGFEGHEVFFLLFFLLLLLLLLLPVLLPLLFFPCLSLSEISWCDICAVVRGGLHLCLTLSGIPLANL